jgi:hypothetical protein
MICGFICPVSDLITHKEMPSGWTRRPTAIMDKGMERQVKLSPMHTT